MRLIAFFHVFPRKGFERIVGNVLSVFDAGLSLMIEKIVVCVQTIPGRRPDIDGVDIPASVRRKLEIRHISNTCAEWDTLVELWDFCRGNQDHLVLYVHTKGVAHGGPHKDDWREMMLHFCVERWSNAVAVFDDLGINAAGCNMKNKQPRRRSVRREFFGGGRGPWDLWHFSGNFWWARASAISALPDPRTEETRRTLTWKGVKQNLAAELWIGLVGSSHMASLHQSHVDHQRSLYPRSCYELTS